jgi:hypothetical protein
MPLTLPQKKEILQHLEERRKDRAKVRPKVDYFDHINNASWCGVLSGTPEEKKKRELVRKYFSEVLKKDIKTYRSLLDKFGIVPCGYTRNELRVAEEKEAELEDSLASEEEEEEDEIAAEVAPLPQAPIEEDFTFLSLGSPSRLSPPGILRSTPKRNATMASNPPPTPFSSPPRPSAHQVPSNPPTFSSPPRQAPGAHISFFPPSSPWGAGSTSHVSGETQGTRGAGE